MLGGLFEMRHPVEQRWLVGMCGQATDGVDFRAYRDAFAKQGDLTRTIDQPPPQRPRSLEADNQDGAFTAPQVVAQMVANASSITHAAGGNDHQTAAYLVQRHRLFKVLHEAYIETPWIGLGPGVQRARFVVPEFTMA